MENSQIEVETDQLADFLFNRNINDDAVVLDLSESEDAEDVFLFCVDLLCKGISLVCRGQPIDTITSDQLETIVKKMRNAGIQPTLCIKPKETELIPELSMASPTELPLDQYSFHVNTENITYKINFRLGFG